jgi:transposase
MRQIGELRQPLYELMRTRVLKSKLLGTDDTPVPVLVPGRGKTQEARHWAYRGDDAHPFNVFDFTMTRKRDGPLKFLRRDEQSKAEQGFAAICRPMRMPATTCCSGWAASSRWGAGCGHRRDSVGRRRKFFEAKEADLARGMEALARIRLLYEVKEATRELSPVERLVVRQERAVPLLASFKAWLDEQSAKALPRSAMGEAMN